MPTRLFFCSSTASTSPSSLPSTRGWASFSTRMRSPGIEPFISRPGMKISPEPSSSMAKPKFLPSLTRVQSRALSLRPDRTVKKTPWVWQTTASRTSSSSASITLRSAARSPPNLAFRSLTVQGCIWMARSILSLIGIQVILSFTSSAHRLLLRAGATSQPGSFSDWPGHKNSPAQLRGPAHVPIRPARTICGCRPSAGRERIARSAACPLALSRFFRRAQEGACKNRSAAPGCRCPNFRRGARPACKFGRRPLLRLGCFCRRQRLDCAA